MTLYKDLIGADPLPALPTAQALREKYPTFAPYPDEVLAVLFETYQALRGSPAKLSLALTFIKSALVAFGKGDGLEYKINVMSLRLFCDHARQIVSSDL